MCRAFVVIVLVTLIHLGRAVCFNFPITRNLSNSRELENSLWIRVEVTKTNLIDEDIDDGSVAVKFEIPKALLYKDVFVFFANDSKQILQVNLISKIHGKFYSSPYKFEKEVEGNETTKVEEENFTQISGNIPAAWLPTNCSKINAAIVDPKNEYYNYYKVLNFKVSLPDL